MKICTVKNFGLLPFNLPQLVNKPAKKNKQRQLMSGQLKCVWMLISQTFKLFVM